MLFADLWTSATIVGIDLRPRNDHVIDHLAKLGLSQRIRLHHEVSQSDRERVTNIIESSFVGEIDIIIDDASHQYHFTKATFEITFPYLANGGLYIIEDWAWAHWKNWQGENLFSRSPAMSNLVFQLVMASASSSNIIANVSIDSNICVIEKSKNCPPLNKNKTFKLDDIYFLRGKKLDLI
jgi:hypothetical protein